MNQADEFLAVFFGPGNLVLPDLNFEGEVGRRLTPYLEPLRQGTKTPLVLPRRTREITDAYVICWDRHQATSLRAILEAFVAHSYVAFDGRPRRLDPADPVEGAVLRLVGPDTAYVLRPPGPAHAASMWRALDLMRILIAGRPERVSAVPRPLGRMLSEFHAALAAGNAAGSADLLDELAGAGLSAVNLAYLRVHRLSRLGRDAELLALPQLGDVVASGPPQLVRDGILAAWGRLQLLDLPMSDPDLVKKAADAILRDTRGIVALARTPLATLSDDALAAVTLVALGRDDRDLARSLASLPDLPNELRSQLPKLTGAPLVETAKPTVPRVRLAPTAPASWVDWVFEVADFTADDVDWTAWPAPVESDAFLAEALEGVKDAEADQAWNLVGPFLEADDMRRPAWRTAKALLVLAASYDRWAPNDVATVQALLEVFLRGAPPADEYREILDMLAENAGRWAVVGNTLPALDMVDDVARSPVSDVDARLRFALAALEPFSRHRRRLSTDLRWLGEQLSVELSAPLAWDVPEPLTDTGEEIPNVIGAKVLIYSLDDGVLQRSADRLAQLFPRVTVNRAHDRVGTPQLRAHARGADVIGLATRCAKHAATGFIRDHASEGAVIIEADGAGSASLIRAVASGLAEMGPPFT
ncbi:hypothetical protein [Sinomonas terrae]|uniref:Uncharacterized protein n=1 Tax=Sinomonas terrae TaxID=2908838 RepID=A0ABS9U210_9MICC|nr:hypothetical protein [Sinomonas terrae]MCH6470690.1 hypothetical protein [Sinomonas terrae]